MKIVAFSDIHGNIYAYRAFLKALKNIEYDHLVFLGDIFGYYYHQKEIIIDLKKHRKLLWLKGNHDQYAIDIYKGTASEEHYICNYGHSYQNIKSYFSDSEIVFLDALPNSFVLLDGQITIGIFHGMPDDELNGRLYPNSEINHKEIYKPYNIVIQGHTHYQMVRYVETTLIVNPGSLGQPRDGHGYSYAIINTLNRSVSFRTLSFDISLLYQEINMRDPSLIKLKEVLERKAQV